jgi:serine/threonine-protein kinase
MSFRPTRTLIEAPLDLLRRNTVPLVVSSLVAAACLGSTDSSSPSGGTAGNGTTGSTTGAGSSAGGAATTTGTSWTATGSSVGGSISSGGGSAGASSGMGGSGGSAGGAGRAGNAGSAGSAGSAGRPGNGTGGAPGTPDAGSPGGTPPPFIDSALIFRWIATDIVAARSVDQPFQRYLSLAHLRNAGASDQDMDLYRAAMIKGMNALSQGTRIVAPRAIDPYNTVYRIDLRDLEWDAQPSSGRTDKWQVLVDADPYAIEYLEDDAQTAKTLTKTSVPMQSGNWLVFAGMTPPLYHDVLGVPARLADLERQLGVDIAQDIAREQVDRSGFATSGVTQQNRVIERHDGASAANQSLWITYDFAGVGGRRSIFAHPLDFQQDGSEVIFTLPNGLHGYMVVDGAGNRLNQVNLAIEKDVSQRDGQVTNGISCVGCHDDGIKFKKDEIRDFVQGSFDFDAQAKDLVDALYSPQADFQTLVTQDANAFSQQLRAMAFAPTVTREPVSAVFHNFEQDVDLTTAASELGFTAQQLLSQLGRLNPDLAPLATGAIKRDVFRDRFAQTVCLLKIGLANDAACRR